MFKIDWKSWFKEDDIIIKLVFVLVLVVVFCFGISAGIWITYNVLNDRFYTEMRSADSAIWIKIEAAEGKKGDLIERIDRIARVMDEYDLAVAQVKVYENRQEIMNVRISDDD